MYSSQPEESTRTRSEAVISIAVVILPFHAFGDSTQLLDGARLAEANRPIQDINVQLLAGPELKLLAHTLGNYYLEFGRNFDGFHEFVLQVLYRPRLRMSNLLSTKKCGNVIDRLEYVEHHIDVRTYVYISIDCLPAPSRNLQISFHRKPFSPRLVAVA